VGWLFTPTKLVKKEAGSMRQVWLAPEIIQGNDFSITGDAHHHLFSVMRLKTGEEFEAISGQGQAVRLKVLEVSKKSALVTVTARRELQRLQEPLIGLAFCMPKFPVFEDILEKIVEMGLYTIQPLISERSFLRNAKDLNETRLERWQRIVESATAQSQRAEILKMEPLQTLAGFISQFSDHGFNPKDKSACLMAYEGSTNPIRSTLEAVKPRNPRLVWYLIGPEGGFSENEANLLNQQGISQVSLGHHILRTDSACFTMLSILKYELGILK
jgi:16S rRNA (uracil1498-N3)-methyltransferase